MSKYTICVIVILVVSLPLSFTKKYKDKEKPDWAKKDIRDFTDADLERLLDQWEVNTITFGGCSKNIVFLSS